ncbi:MAG: PAS domain-containing sensor histidine kinase [Promethearchaeota archaeon]|jgi:PAS domain S-box-containing protein
MIEENTNLIFEAIEMLSSDNELIGIGMIQEGYFIFANKGLADIFECSVEDILNKEKYGWFDSIHPGDLDFVKENLSDLENKGKNSTIFFNCRIVPKSRRIKWVKLNSKVISNRGSTFILITMQDYTEMVELNLAINKPEKKDMRFDLDFDQLLDENPLLGISIFQDNKIKYVNKHLSDIIGYDFYDLMNMTVYNVMDFIPFEYRSLIKLNFQEVERGNKETLDITYPLNNKSGIKIWVHSYGRRFNFLGKPAVFVLTKFVSTYKKNEENSENSINFNEPVVDDTIKKELEQNLNQLNVKLNEINDLKKELLYRISHELKTPLIPVKGYADLLLRTYKGKLDDKIISYLRAIMDGSDRLENLINELLESSSLEKSQIKLNLKEGDLTALIEHTLERLDNVIKLRDHSIILNLNDKLLTKFDEEKIHKALSNILLNAINYTPKKGQIRISSRVNNDNILICIKDDGIGLTEDEKNRLFKQFGKIERYGKGWDIASDGAGFGLYNSKKIIELHNGKIWVESEGKNQGSTFCISIPII